MVWLCDGIYASNWRTGWGGYLDCGPNTGVLAIAKAGYLPKFSKTNRHGMGHHLMFVQGIIVSVLSVTFVIMPSVQAAFQILSQLTVMLYLVMYMLMFASAIYLRHSQPDTKRPYRAPALFSGQHLDS